MRRKYIDTPLGQVNVYDGEIGRPLVLLHQTPTCALEFEPTWPLLHNAGYRVLGVDTPGYGYSDTPPEPPTLADYAAILPLMLDQLGIDRTLLCGVHTGAQIGFEAAVAYPERFAGFVAHSVPLFTSEQAEAGWNRSVTYEQNAPQFRPRDDGSHLAEAFARPRGFGASLALAQNMVAWSLLAGPEWWYGHNAAYRQQLAPLIEAASVPTMFLSYEAEPLHGHTLRAHALRPDVPLTVLDWTPGDELITSAAPALWVDALHQFFRTV